MEGPPHRPVLADHVAVKRKLVPPFMKRLGPKLHQFSWTRQLVPEAIWIGLIVDRCGYKDARQHCIALSQAVRLAIDDAARPMLVRLSTFLSLSDTEKATVLSNIDARAFVAIRSALQPLTAMAPAHHATANGPCAHEA